jgi:hypothetical protein
MVTNPTAREKIAVRRLFGTILYKHTTCLRCGAHGTHALAEPVFPLHLAVEDVRQKSVDLYELIHDYFFPKEVMTARCEANCGAASKYRNLSIVAAPEMLCLVPHRFGQSPTGSTVKMSYELDFSEELDLTRYL